MMGLWSQEHAATLPAAVAVMLVICAILRFTIGKMDRKIRMIPLQIVAVLLVILEIGKQWVSISRGYDLYHIPLHFCSIFIFALPVMSFYRGKHMSLVSGVVAGLCAACSGLTLIYPTLIYSAGNIKGFFADYLDFHTVAFHNLVIFAFFLIIALQLHTPEKKGEPKAIALFLVAFCTIAAIFSQLLQTNYAGFYSCNVPVFESLRLSMQPILGYGITQLIYVVALMAVHVLFVWGFYWIYRGLRKLTVMRQTEKV